MKVITVFHHLHHLIVYVSTGVYDLALSILWLDAAAAYGSVFLLYECVGLEKVLLCVCMCGNYCDLNAGSAGETGCLLINEWSRWPQVGGSCERTASRSGGQHNTDTWAITNKTSQAVNTSQRHQLCVCLCVCVHTAFLSLSTNRCMYHVAFDWKDDSCPFNLYSSVWKP